MPALGNALDFAKYEGRNFRAHQLGSPPSSPVPGQLYFNTVDNTLWWWDPVSGGSGAWISARGGATQDATTSSKGVIQLAGDLAGTAASPQIAAGVITDAEVNSLNKDGAAGTASMRTLGSGATQAAPGNDGRFSDSRPPTGAAGGDLAGSTYPNPVIAPLKVDDTKVATANKDGAVGTPSMRTLGTGAVQAFPGNGRLDQVAIPTADVSMNNRKLTNVADPIGAQDATNKTYVDNIAQGIDAKQSVKAATTANIANVLTGAPNTLDGQTLVIGDRVLVKDQTAQATNGIYTVTTVGTGANGVWARAADMDAWAEVPAAYVFVEQGTTQADTGWLSTADPGGTLGSTNITWVQFSGAGQVIAGGGLTKTGNQLDVGAGPGITVNADTIQVANDGISNAMIADGAINLGTADVTGTLPLTKGGTGQTTAPLARTALGAAGVYTSATHGAGTTISIPQTTHLLGAGRGKQVQVQEEATGAVVITDVVVAANGDVTVTFGVSVAANAYRVTIVG